MVDTSKYLGKWWRRDLNTKSKRKEEIYYFFDIKSREYPRRDGGITLYGFLALKIVYSGSYSRKISFTNPTEQHMKWQESFFEYLKREDSHDYVFHEIIENAFKLGVDKWKKRYYGYKNIGIE